MSNSNKYTRFTDQQLLFMYKDKLRQAAIVEPTEGWRKDQLEADSDKIFDELLTRGFFFSEANVSLLNHFQRGN